METNRTNSHADTELELSHTAERHANPYYDADFQSNEHRDLAANVHTNEHVGTAHRHAVDGRTIVHVHYLADNDTSDAG